jgi:hypothetical protein
MYDVIGFPLHLPLVDKESITDAVKSVEIHRSHLAKEFAIVVHIEPYPAAIHSLWIYLAQFNPKK